MIAFVKGILVEKNPTFALIESNGIGYMIHISLQTYSKLPQANESCKLLTHLVVREDAHMLYGFHTEKERILFRQLITVSGIGTNTARMMLSAMNTNELTAAILNENSKLLQGIKGIGAKTAQRVVLDLKDKVDKDVSALDKILTAHNTNKDEALLALVSLGFVKNNADIALSKIIKAEGSELSIEVLIKKALQIL
ncbi:MAG: Holliday junction branch migration protein RuvA [Bacteroidota bacterium]